MDGLTLTNAEFPLEFNGQTYQVKKANLRQMMLFQRRTKEITDEKDAAIDARMLAYALFLVLSPLDGSITEEYVENNCPGDLDLIDTLSKLGFMSPQRTAAMNRLREVVAPSQPTGGESSA